ncbi:MAG: hypothetical protein GXO79_05190 [Chlorobi bacterium]|nr:hypothetical protein [Chlorobiota bacterium]
MNSNISKYISIGSYSIMGISALLAILFYAGVIGVDPFLIWAYILFSVAIVVTIVFSFVQIFSSTKSAKRGLMGIGILIVLVFISWLIASPEIPQFIGVDDFNLTPAVSRNVGTGLIVTYILAVVAIGSMLYSELKNIIK